MQVELTIPESDYLKHLLDTAHKSLLHELHHANAHEFKDVLKHQLEMNEKVSQKIEPKAGRG